MTVEEFKKILAVGHKYRSLYHFTDRANLSSIAKYGILSKQYATDALESENRNASQPQLVQALNISIP